MNSVAFLKVVGSGNDFILIDARRRPLRGESSRFARIWCNRILGVGADGLLLVLPPQGRSAKARMRIFNPDGSEASMCGNGLRCVAWYLYSKDHGGKDFLIQTKAGVLQAKVVGREQVRIVLSPPSRFRLGLSLTYQGRRLFLHSVNTGVPHAVLFISSKLAPIKISKLDQVDLGSLGPAIRFHRLFRPEGTNVNCVELKGRSSMAIRTYERGVEAETFGCGTGAVASVVIGAALGKLKPPVRVMTRSGETLIVDFKSGPPAWRDLTLQGPARISFQGLLGLKSFSKPVLKSFSKPV